jgi:hypothetical protein
VTWCCSTMETEHENKHFVGQLKLDHGMKFMEDGTRVITSKLLTAFHWDHSYNVFKWPHYYHKSWSKYIRSES